MRKRTLSAMLLVGGYSRRMGMDKATIPINGKPLWKRQLELLKKLRPAALWLSARIRSPWFPPDIETVFDQPPSRGPLSGIAVGLNYTETSHLLVLAVDLPQVTASHLAKLWALAGAGVGVIPSRDNDLEPLCAIYPVEATALAFRALQNGDASVQNFGHQLLEYQLIKTHPLSPGEKPLYLNMNEPSDIPQRFSSFDSYEVGAS